VVCGLESISHRFLKLLGLLLYNSHRAQHSTQYTAKSDPQYESEAHSRRRTGPGGSSSKEAKPFTGQEYELET
jgi:hypothetical protein